MPEVVEKCVASWKKYCPDYQIIRWDENNFDYTKYRFTKDAYNHKKWAFVSDVARLDIVFNYGGIYLDTDVELIKPLDFLLGESAFMAFEQDRTVNTGLGFGAEKGNFLIKENLEQYESLDFVNSDGTLNLITCPSFTTAVLEAKGLVRKNKMQQIDGLTVFPTEFFCPRLFSDGSAEIKPETVAIHHFAGSWTTDEDKRIAQLRRDIYTRYGRFALRVYDGFRMLRNNGWRAVAKRCVEIINGE